MGVLKLFTNAHSFGAKCRAVGGYVGEEMVVLRWTNSFHLQFTAVWTRADNRIFNCVSSNSGIQCSLYLCACTSDYYRSLSQRATGTGARDFHRYCLAGNCIRTNTGRIADWFWELAVNFFGKSAVLYTCWLACPLLCP